MSWYALSEIFWVTPSKATKHGGLKNNPIPKAEPRQLYLSNFHHDKATGPPSVMLPSYTRSLKKTIKHIGPTHGSPSLSGVHLCFCWCLFEILVGNDTISIIVQGLNVTVQTREA